MTVRFTMKSGRQCEVHNIAKPFREFVNILKTESEGFLVCDDIAIKLKEIEVVEEMK